MTGPTTQPTDDLDTFLAEQLRDPHIAGAYHDAGNEARTCLALTAARKNAGMSRGEVAACLAYYTGMSCRRARRWVNRYEDGELGGNAPTWLLHAYARAVGVAVRISVVTAEGAAA